VRKRINLSPRLLEAYYREVEQARFPEDPASRRLLVKHGWSDPWSLSYKDASQSLEEAASKADQALDGSDQHFELEEAAFASSLEGNYNRIIGLMSEQRDIAQHCFEEIARVLSHEDQLANRDVAERRWEDFHQRAVQNVDKARKLIDWDVRHSRWEGHFGETQELRTWVHALLGRGDSPRDRAFCRGFFDGTTNRRTTYASELKLDMLQELQISKDGLYSDDMDQIYHDGARLGFISLCEPLDEVDFESIKDFALVEARERIGLKVGLLAAYQKDIEDHRLML